MKIDESLHNQLASIAKAEGLELLATEVKGAGGMTTVQVVIDGPDGVTLDQCADISRQASAYLDVSDPITHAYTLEVSSPGLDRKLYSRSDYRRFRGRQVKVRMSPSYREHRVVIGELVGLEDDTLSILSDAGQRVDLPFAEVCEARLEVDWESVFKEGKCPP
jgi:ribosome maturation factor RimP